MGLFGIGDDNRMLVDIPARYVPILGLPEGSTKINIVVSKGKGKAKERKDAVDQLMKYGIPYQAALSLVGEDYEILDNKKDPGWNDWRLEDSSPEEVAAGRGRTGMRRGIDVAAGAEYGQRKPISPFWDLDATPFESQTVTGERAASFPSFPQVAQPTQSFRDFEQDGFQQPTELEMLTAAAEARIADPKEQKPTFNTNNLLYDPTSGYSTYNLPYDPTSGSSTYNLPYYLAQAQAAAEGRIADPKEQKPTFVGGAGYEDIGPPYDPTGGAYSTYKPPSFDLAQAQAAAEALLANPEAMSREQQPTFAYGRAGYEDIGPVYDPTGGAYSTYNSKLAQAQAAAEARIADPSEQEPTFAAGLDQPDDLVPPPVVPPKDDDSSALVDSGAGVTDDDYEAALTRMLEAGTITQAEADSARVFAAKFAKDFDLEEYIKALRAGKAAVVPPVAAQGAGVADGDTSALVDSGDDGAGFADDDTSALVEPMYDPTGGAFSTYKPPSVVQEKDPLTVTPWTPLEGATSIEDMLNIFMQNPEKYYTTTTVIGPDNQPITQQVLNPAAKAALQAFSVQRGAEAMETGARFGTGGPFGAIAGLGGTSQQAIDLAEQQAYSGITSPFAALQTGGGIDQISQILRGGVTAEEQRLLAGLEARGGLTATQQSDLAGLQARGGLSADEQRQLAGLQARGGLGVADQFALAGMQARGGLTPDQMRGLAGLQARGGLTPQQRMAEQRMALMPSLFQMTPQSLGGFSEVFGKENLQNYLSPFFAQPDFAAQGTAPGIDWTGQQALTPQALPPQALPPGTQPGPGGAGFSQEEQYIGSPVSSNLLYSRPLQPEQRGIPRQNLLAMRTPTEQRGIPRQNLLAAATPTPAPQTRQTLGGYRKASPFARGGTQAKAAIAGKDLEDYLGEVTPFGGETRRGGLGARRTRQLTY